jgi:regulator of sigma E protease
MSILLLVVGVLLFISLIVVHEFGHFIMARRNGVEVEEFAIFVPPRLYKRVTRDGWLFSINLIPLGGYVKLKGEHDSDTEKGSFGAASVWVKSKIMVAGVAMNLITALVLFTIIALIGMPKLVDNQFTVKSDTKTVAQHTLVGGILAGSPAAKAGLRSQDELTNIIPVQQKSVAASKNAGNVTDATTLRNITKKFAGKTVAVYFMRGGQQRQVQLTLLSAAVVQASQKTDNPKGYLGIEPNDFTLRRSTWSAPVLAVGLSAQLTVLTFQGFGHALGGLGSLIAGFFTHNTVARQHGQTSATAQVGGPVAIYFILKGGSLLGYQFMLFIIAYISLVLALTNFLPIPALDGGRLWLMLVSRSLKRPLSAKLEERIVASGMVVLLSLMVLITIVDVKRFF